MDTQQDMGSGQPLRILLVDDDANFGAAMAKALRRRGHEVQTVHDGARAVEILRTPQGPAQPQVAVLDLRMPGLGGLEVLRRSPQRRIPVVVLTGHGSVPDAVECMRLGAYTFLTKPVDAADLAPVLQQAVRPAATSMPETLTGVSEATVQLRRLIERLASTVEPVLLVGETGTGKEVAARMLHRCSGGARTSFVAVNMACLSPQELDAELFGDQRWSGESGRAPRIGLFESVGDGTLFLDEITQLSLDDQAKLLRVIEARSFRPLGQAQERPFLGRLVAATHQDLRALVAQGQFREDLYYRLQVFPLQLQPLRSRREDILPIAQEWLQQIAQGALTLSEAAQQVLWRHDWPGNARELVNLMRRLCLVAKAGPIEAPLVQQMLAHQPFPACTSPHCCTPPERALAPAAGEGLLEGLAQVEVSLEELEQRYVRALLARHRNITHVAKILEINRRTLQRKLRAWGMGQGLLEEEAQRWEEGEEPSEGLSRN